VTRVARQSRLDGLFRIEAGTYDLDVCRFLFYLALLFWFAPTDWQIYAKAPQVLYEPPPVQRWLGLPAPGAWIGYLKGVWLGSLALSMLGLLTLFSTRVAFVLGFYLLGVDWSFGNTHHSHHLIVLCLFALACSKPSQKLSLDRLWATHGGPSWLLSSKPSDETWCVRACQMAWCWMFFIAGVSKLRHAGSDFWAPHNFQQIVLVTASWYSSSDLLGGLHDRLRRAVLESDALATFLAASGVILEILVPLAFFSRRRFRWLIIGGLAMLQFGAYLLFYISEFKKISAVYIFWIPWTYLGERLGVISLAQPLADSACSQPGESVQSPGSGNSSSSSSSSAISAGPGSSSGSDPGSSESDLGSSSSLSLSSDAGSASE